MALPPKHRSPATSRYLPPSTNEFDAQVARLLEMITRCDRFVVASHVFPDGDAVGSTLAMAQVLEQLGKEVIAYNRDPIPHNFAFLDAAGMWKHTIPEGFDAQATIVLDCAAPSRLGDDAPAHIWGDAIAVVDHHKTYDADFADVYVRDVGAAATGELIYRIAVTAGVELGKELSEALYCCLMTDTGSFRYSATSKTTFCIAGELLEAGVEPWQMTARIYESQPRERLHLLAEVLSTLNISSEGRLATLRIERAALDAAGGGVELTDGFINYARSIDGVEVATQFLELEADTYKVSFRSRGRVDVSDLAQRFGGGGHHNAAGFTFKGPLDQLEADLSSELKALIAGMDDV